MMAFPPKSSKALGLVKDAKDYPTKHWICRQVRSKKEDFLLIENYEDILLFTF